MLLQEDTVYETDNDSDKDCMELLEGTGVEEIGIQGELLVAGRALSMQDKDEEDARGENIFPQCAG